jgi:hypothetical protein
MSAIQQRKLVRRATFEGLEQRRLLAGNVSVVYDPGTNTYNVSGDNKANELIVSGLFIGPYTITGVGGTTINGQSSIVVPAAGAQGSNFNVALGNGEDRILFNNFSADAVKVSTGNGDDDVAFNNVTAFGGIDINTGNGDDDLLMDFVDVYEGLNVKMGNGDDTVTFAPGFGVRLFSGDAHIDGGNGHDTITGESNLHIFAVTQNIDIEDFEA